MGQQWEHTQALAHHHSNTALSLLLLFSRQRKAHARFRDWTSVQSEVQHSQWYPELQGMPKPKNIIHGQKLLPRPTDSHLEI